MSDANYPKQSEDRYEVCPKCGKSFNHWVDNGYRNTWPKGVDFEICTTADSEHVFVHTQDLLKTTIEDVQDELDAIREELSDGD